MQSSSIHRSTSQDNTSKQWIIHLILQSFAILTCFADRAILAASIIELSQKYDWDSEVKGLILSSFFYGYAATQMLAGWFSDKYGGKNVLTIGMVVWSFCTVITPASARWGLPLLVLVRFVLGLAQGVAMPSVQSMVASNVPYSARSTAVSSFTSCSILGVAIAFYTSPVIIQSLGTEWVFYIYGTLLCIWLPLWIPQKIKGKQSKDIAPKNPCSEEWQDSIITPLINQSLYDSQNEAKIEDCLEDSSISWSQGRVFQQPQIEGNSKADQPSCKTQYAIHTNANTQSSEDYTQTPSLEQPLQYQIAQTMAKPDTRLMQDPIQTDFLDRPSQNDMNKSINGVGTPSKYCQGKYRLFLRKEVWAIAITQYCQAFGYFAMMNWLPTYFKEVYDLDYQGLEIDTLVPFLLRAAVGGTSGLLADKMIGSGFSVRFVRVILQSLAMLVPALFFALTVSPLTIGSPKLATCFITIANGFAALIIAAVNVNNLDIAPRNAGLIYAFGNSFATIAGLIGVQLIGVLLQVFHSWSMVFILIAALNVVGAGVWCVWAGGEVLPEDSF